MSRIALRRAALSSVSPLARLELGLSDSSGSLHAGQRLAKPGLPGFSSNSSPQTAQVRIGNGMEIFYPDLACRSTLSRLEENATEPGVCLSHPTETRCQARTPDMPQTTSPTWSACWRGTQVHSKASSGAGRDLW